MGFAGPMAWGLGKVRSRARLTWVIKEWRVSVSPRVWDVYGGYDSRRRS